MYVCMNVTSNFCSLTFKNQLFILPRGLEFLCKTYIMANFKNLKTRVVIQRTEYALKNTK